MEKKYLEYSLKKRKSLPSNLAVKEYTNTEEEFINNILEKINLDKKDEVYNIFEKFSYNNRFFKTKKILTGIIYLVAKKTKPLTIREMSYLTGFSIYDIERKYKKVCRQLGIKIRPPKPEKFIERIANIFNIDEEKQKEAKELANKCNGVCPHVSASVSLYLCTNIDKNKFINYFCISPSTFKKAKNNMRQ